MAPVLFTSFQYLLFLPLVVALYWVMPKRFRLPMLLCASYLFYMSWMPAFILLILPMTFFNWLCGGLLSRTQVLSQRKLCFGIGVGANLLCLAVFKYADFAAQSLAAVLKLTTHQAPHWALNIILPLGISFFTFEFIHYLFEIYRGRKPINSFVLFALFAAFFPTQIAGPIKRFPDFEEQMLREQKLSLDHFDEGIPLIIVGLAKKLLLADNLSIFVRMGFDNPALYGGLECWLFAYAFAFQIYFDFSGYTDIGRGSAMLFGYHIPINFNMPYIAKNISDFWHRWHISLSSWLRDYLFIPLGGSKAGRWLTHRNLFLTMALGGLWHGASWNFVIWGIYHGVCLIVHREFVVVRKSYSALHNAMDSWCGKVASMVLTFNVVCIGWVFFRMQDLPNAFSMIKKMILLRPLYSPGAASQFVVLRHELPIIVPIVICMVSILLLQNIPVSLAQERKIFKRPPAILRAAACSLLVLLMVALSSDDSTPFIYFQF